MSSRIRRPRPRESRTPPIEKLDPEAIAEAFGRFTVYPSSGLQDTELQRAPDMSWAIDRTHALWQSIGLDGESAEQILRKVTDHLLPMDLLGEEFDIDLAQVACRASWSDAGPDA
jgi:hypothetical protein